MSITYNNIDDDLLEYVDLGTTIVINRSYTLDNLIYISTMIIDTWNTIWFQKI